MLYFSGGVIPSSIWQDRDKVKYVNPKYFADHFNKLSSKTIVNKLLRYFLYGEDPENNDAATIYYFAKPTPVTEVLKYFYEKDDDEDFLTISKMITKKLNTNQQKILDEKYKACTFKSVEKVPKTYPHFAFRNISIKQWQHSDLRKLDMHERDYMVCVKNQKYKFKSTVTDKPVPSKLIIRGNYRFYSRRDIQKVQHEKERDLRQYITDSRDL
jgi:hypothetical protein